MRAGDLFPPPRGAGPRLCVSSQAEGGSVSAVIEETEVTGIQGKRTPRESLEVPTTRLKKEPVLIVDVSGSNAEDADPEGTVTKVDLVCDVIEQIVPLVEGDDAEAAGEQAGGSSDKGGLRTFAANEPAPIEFDDGEDESDDERDLGDINTVNLPQKLAEIRRLVAECGRTFILPAFVAAKHAFDTEFPNDKNRCLEIIFINDGKLNDESDVEKWVAEHAGPRCVIAVTVVGYDNQPSNHGHDAAVAAWNKISAANKYVAVDAVTGVSDAQEVAFDIQFMAGLAA